MVNEGFRAPASARAVLQLNPRISDLAGISTSPNKHAGRPQVYQRTRKTMASCFVTATPLRLLPLQSSTLLSRPPPATSITPVRAELKDLVPGEPSGQSAREGAPLRYYVPKPKETYEDRSFATILPKTWEGETDTIGALDVKEREKLTGGGALVEEGGDPFSDISRQSTGAFVDYARMMEGERRKSLEKLQNKEKLVGRATCGPEEGKEKVSNFDEDLYIKPLYCVEYWNKTTYDMVPRRFGGPTA